MTPYGGPNGFGDLSYLDDMVRYRSSNSGTNNRFSSSQARPGPAHPSIGASSGNLNGPSSYYNPDNLDHVARAKLFVLGFHNKDDDDDPRGADRIEARTLEYGSAAEQKREIAVDLLVGNYVFPGAYQPYKNMPTDQLTRLIAEKIAQQAGERNIAMSPEQCQAEAVRQVNREFHFHEQFFVDIERVAQAPSTDRQAEQSRILREKEQLWITQGYDGLRPGRFGREVYARLGRRGYGGIPRSIPSGFSEDGPRGFY